MGSLPDDVAASYPYPDPLPASGRWVRANMVASVDGAVVGPEGRTASLSTAPDRTVFGLLRHLADAVLIGAGTARIERYGPTRVPEAVAAARAAQGQRPTPVLVVVSRSLNLSGARFPAADAGEVERPLVVTVEASEPMRRTEVARFADVVVAGEDRVDLPAAVAELVARGLPRILCEGGPTLLEELVAAGLVDELCLTISPVLVGSGPGRILTGVGLPDPVPLTLAEVMQVESTLLTRWVRA
jgi:riboflavin biosynthesis pyrimidine reductase